LEALQLELRLVLGSCHRLHLDEFYCLFVSLGFLGLGHTLVLLCKFEVESIFLFNFLMCSYTIVVANNSINRSGRSVGLAKSNILWHTLLSPAADVSNEGIDAGVVGLSEIFLLLGIDDTLLDTHLIELLEITLSLLGLAL